MRNKVTGLTLLEILICISILLVTLVSMRGLDFRDWRSELKIAGVMQEIISGISLARLHAISDNITVTICRSSDGERCAGQWKDGAIIFSDSNEDRVLNGLDRLLYRIQFSEMDGNIRFNSFQNRQYLQITGQGFTKFQNGNFTFCSSTGDPKLNKQIIISLTGRTRFAVDHNGDGIVENSQGNPVVCL